MYPDGSRDFGKELFYYMKKIAVLGSTGSIGTQTLDIVRANPDLRVVALAAGSSVEKMEAQVREFHPLIVGMWSGEAAKELRLRLADVDVRVVSGMEGLLEIAVFPQSEVLVTAIVGMIGIRPTIAAIEAGKAIALANKETLGEKARSSHSSGGQRAQRNFPVFKRRALRENIQDPVDGIRRSFQGQDQEGTPKRPGGGCAEAS